MRTLIPSILTFLIPLLLSPWHIASAQEKRPAKNDVIITIAWPCALAKQTDAGYNDVARALGINRRGYYRAGHAHQSLLLPTCNE